MDQVVLQKQIRDNNEDLERYIIDLESWQDEMKRKEREMYGDEDDSDEILPPVRSKMKKNTDNTQAKCTQVQDKPAERIKSDDYSAWDKFDVEKACETLNAQPPTKNIEEAIYEKETGNKLVKLGKWKEAMECYSRAITHDSSNPIFYANRAQCALKLDMWQQVVTDCTKALALEEGYVKAMLRRATAYSKLKNYEGATIDLQRALQLEPNNKEVKTFLAKVTADVRKQQEAAAANVILAISKPPHLRSKVPLKRIPVEEVGGEMTGMKEVPAAINECTSSHVTISPIKAVPVISKPEKEIHKTPQQDNNFPVSPTNNTKSKSPITQLQRNYADHLPPAPKTSVQFMLAWSQLRPQQHFAYLQQIPGEGLPQLFGNSLESKLLSEVLSALTNAPADAPIFQYLQGLTQARRFSTLTLFMSKQDKEGVRQLLSRCLTEPGCCQDEVEKLRHKYEL